MTLAENLAEIFKQEMQIVIDKEQADENYLTAENYPNNLSRAYAGVQEATEQVVLKLGIFICQHRAVGHEENIALSEKAKIENEIKPEYKDSVSTRDWWNA